MLFVPPLSHYPTRFSEAIFLKVVQNGDCFLKVKLVKHGISPYVPRILDIAKDMSKLVAFADEYQEVVQMMKLVCKRAYKNDGK